MSEPVMGCHQPSKKTVIEMVKNCFYTLNTFGKPPEALESITENFLFALADYRITLIKDAFVKYLKTSGNMPTPIDIITIINGLGYTSPEHQRSVRQWKQKMGIFVQ